MEPLSNTDPRAEAQRRLLVDSVTLEVTAAMKADGVGPLLLKGPAITSWIYRPGEPRTYVDTDLLIDPLQLERACVTLARLGFVQTQSDIHVEDFAEPHAQTWRRPKERVTVDLHWRIPGVGAKAESAWPRLSRSPESVVLGMGRVDALGFPARALHLALHAVQNGRDGEKSLRDLELGLARLEGSVWESASLLAREVDAAEPFAVALTMLPDGQRLLTRLGLEAPLGSVWQLWASSPPPGAVRLHALLSAKSFRARARMLVSSAFPAPLYMRAMYSQANRGVGGLLVSYVRRLGSGAALLPKALRAVRSARSTERAGRR